MCRIAELITLHLMLTPRNVGIIALLTKRLDVPTLTSNANVMFRSNGDLNNGEIGKKSPKSQLSGLHRELGAILKEIKVIFSPL